VLIDAYASLRHYAEHLAPVWAALPAELRGSFYSPSRTEQWGQPLDRARDRGRLVLVASWRDAQTVGPSPLVYVEHGAGQSYDGDPRSAGNGSYSGGHALDRVRLFLCPNQQVADRWQARYPEARTAVVGCPKLDAWHAAAPWAERTVGRPVVAVTFQLECPLVPETRSAWGHYDHHLPALVADPRWQVLGHGHPRLWGAIRRRWRDLHTEHTPDLADVLDRADLLVADNTSALYEFASTGRPVLVLNAPWYRRHVDHGLRFWSHPPGLQVDRPADLVAGVARALADPPAARAIRARATAHVYAHTDGQAARRAAEAIKELHRA
jgi:hypothetical protein